MSESLGEIIRRAEAHLGHPARVKIRKSDGEWLAKIISTEDGSRSIVGSGMTLEACLESLRAELCKA